MPVNRTPAERQRGLQLDRLFRGSPRQLSDQVIRAHSAAIDTVSLYGPQTG